VFQLFIGNRAYLLQQTLLASVRHECKAADKHSCGEARQDKQSFATAKARSPPAQAASEYNCTSEGAAYVTTGALLSIV